MSKIYHIIKAQDWKEAQKVGTYAPESLKNEGFIHFSKADQILGVANSFYKNQNDLLILRVDPDKLKAELKIEPPLEAPMSGVLFPHLYGELNLDAVEGSVNFTMNEDGLFELPADLIG
ncbi:MAG: hypothetical protein CME63_08920 [Halobacteriovoraceae bacterium]|nr:hypothetical protein [Halobacteriovoraceae bacterium]MBC97859.1 hypothetical protein [Halobacteriovoraceae bacterium]|tara:strand:+ start:48079 stop:48435 length:357 start_codon:yes stop_codon:yes gene_type:complete